MRQQLVLSAIGVVLGSLWSLEATSYGLALAPRPAPGLLPFAAGLTLVATSIAAVVHAAVNPAAYAPQDPWPAGNARTRVVVMAVLVTVYSFVVTRIGYVPATLALIVVATRVMGMKSWAGSAAVASILVLCAGFVFIYLLRVPLPTPWFGATY